VACVVEVRDEPASSRKHRPSTRAGVGTQETVDLGRPSYFSI
jgi:hypothetical protein